VNLATKGRVILQALADFLDSADDGGVVLATKGAPEVWIALVGMGARQVHRHGAWSGDGLVAAWALEVRDLDVVVAGDRLEDVIDRQMLRRPGYRAFQGVAGKVDVDLAPRERGVGGQPNQRSLELADVRLDGAGDVEGETEGLKPAPTE